MNLVYKTLPFTILLVVAGFFIGLAGGETFWMYLGMGLIIVPPSLTLCWIIRLTFIHWRRDKASKDKILSEVSSTLIFNAAFALFLFVYTSWKDTGVFGGTDVFFLVWMAANLGALRNIWVPKDEESSTKAEAEKITEEKNKEAV